jgi:ABC-type nickel/cobalt efflux system permease component RcnA
MEHVHDGKARAGATNHHAHYTPADERRAAGEPSVREEQQFTLAMISGAAGFQAFCGAAAVTLLIIGLAGVAARYLTGCAGIALGVALIAYGGVLAARWRQDVAHYVGKSQQLDLAAALLNEVLGGAAGLVLACIGLAGYAPQVMFSCAAIVFGGVLLFGGAAQPVVAILARDDQPRYERLSRTAMDASGGIMAFVGIGAVVLGVLGLIGVGPGFVLAMVAFLAIGGALLLAGLAEAARFTHRFAEIA